ncbi:hypothetical protein [Sphingomonas aracearum]|uniref:Uncharacterized protein n=1 Tax=Sphingomonas aracearum TaxID=2283317 RepID=A0A369VT51_9SPHN|nr:hypothetical protein [Sphingomonas aracearum]RDE05584.1 hypothetical protein DVW87_10145 [Sphingomonas aracearum]
MSRGEEAEQMALDLGSPVHRDVEPTVTPRIVVPQVTATPHVAKPQRAKITGPRPPHHWTPSVPAPRAEMNQMNNRRWIRFLLIHKVWLTDFEKGVCLTTMRQRFPSAKQRRVLWWALYRVYPIGCGKWGSPSSN